MLNRNITAFLRRLEGSPPPAVVLGPAGPISLGFARSLGRRGIPVVMAGLGGRRMLSRYCVEEAGFSGEESLGEFIRELGERLPRKGVMIPAGDAEALFMARNRSRIERHFSFVLPDSAVVEMLVNKKTQYRFAEELGVPLPRTYYPEGPDDIPRISMRVAYPCIVKPVYAHFRQSRTSIIGIRPWEKLLVVDSAQELSNAAARMTQAGLEFVIQQSIGGGDRQFWALYTYLNRAGEPLVSFVVRKLRQFPPVYGTGCYSVSCRNDDVLDLGLRILTRARHRGLANVEFKLDPADGRYKLIEVNARCGGRVGLAVDAGADIPHVAYRDALGEPVAPVCSYREGMKWVNSSADFGAFLLYRRSGVLRFRQWFPAVAASESRAYFSWDDPVPFLMNFGHAALGVARRFLRK